mmetsp:Transcript_10418/g.22018  ORF Transcript_10418/g.22018 Transcript_10418/m.22018 type:complete len:210 (-) Transcript_10418:524-1153(-)
MQRARQMTALVARDRSLTTPWRRASRSSQSSMPSSRAWRPSDGRPPRRSPSWRQLRDRCCRSCSAPSEPPLCQAASWCQSSPPNSSRVPPVCEGANGTLRACSVAWKGGRGRARASAMPSPPAKAFGPIRPTVTLGLRSCASALGPRSPSRRSVRASVRSTAQTRFLRRTPRRWPAPSQACSLGVGPQRVPLCHRFALATLPSWRTARS